MLSEIMGNIILDIRRILSNFHLLFKVPKKYETTSGYNAIRSFTNNKYIEYDSKRQRFWQIILPTRKSLKSGSKTYDIRHGEDLVYSCDSIERPQIIYINGMLTTKHKAIRDAQYISAIFGKDVLGFYNPTRGFIVDIFESLFGRTFYMRTSISRDAFRVVEEAIDTQDEGERLLLIGHSQGGIIISSVVLMMVRKYGRRGAIKRLRNVDIITFGSGDNGRIYRSLGITHDNLQNKLNICQIRNKYDFVANLSVIRMVNSESQFVINARGHNLVPHYLGNVIISASQGKLPGMMSKYIKFRSKK